MSGSVIHDVALSKVGLRHFTELAIENIYNTGVPDHSLHLQGGNMNQHGPVLCQSQQQHLQSAMKKFFQSMCSIQCSGVKH